MALIAGPNSPIPFVTSLKPAFILSEACVTEKKLGPILLNATPDKFSVTAAKGLRKALKVLKKASTPPRPSLTSSVASSILLPGLITDC